MKGLFESEFVSQLVIILGISLGGWILFVHPKAQELDRMHTVFQTVAPVFDDLTRDDVERLALRLSSGHERIQTITSLNNLGMNTTLLYGMVTELGASNDVVVRSLTPGSRTRQESESGYSVTRMDIVLEGEYSAIAAFIDSIQKLPGFVRPETLNIKPAGDLTDGIAVADFSCDIIQFALPEELQTLKGID